MDPMIERRDTEIVRAAAAGEGSAAEIGRRFGLSGQRVGQILKRRGRARLAEEIFAAWTAGIIPGRIAQRWSLAVDEVEKILLAVVAGKGKRTRRPRGRVPALRARLAPVRVIGWSAFGPDVEHADPAIAAADAAPWRGGRYPKAPSPPPRSLCGSTAAMCAEA